MEKKTAEKVFAEYFIDNGNTVRNIGYNDCINCMEKFATQFTNDNERANYYEDKIDMLSRVNSDLDYQVTAKMNVAVSFQERIIELEKRIEYLEHGIKKALYECPNTKALVNTLNGLLIPTQAGGV